MAYGERGLVLLGQGASTAAGENIKIWFYATDDTKSTVETDGYFDSLSTVVGTGDIIIVAYDIDGSKSARMYIATQSSGDIGIAGVTADTVALAAITGLTDSSGGSAGDTIAAVSGSGADAAINNNFASLVAKFNAIASAV